MDLLEEEMPEDELSPTQQNSINMLNYMSTLTQKVNESSGNQILLEELYSSLVSDMYPNAVDTKTQAQITSLMDTIANYQMIAEKRNRLPATAYGNLLLQRLDFDQTQVSRHLYLIQQS